MRHDVYSLLAAALTLAVFVVPAGLFGQDSPSIDSPRALKKKLKKLHMSLQTQVEVSAAKTAAKEAGEDSESGLERNIVYESTDEISDPDVESARACVNPPQDRRASYSVAIVEFDNSPGRSGIRTPDDKGTLKPDAYFEMMAEHAPPPRPEGRPGLRLIFDIGPGEWHFELGDGWGAPEEARRAVESRTSTLSLRIDEDGVGEAVCEVVREIEAMLGEAEDVSLETYFERQSYLNRALRIRERLDEIDVADLRGVSRDDYFESRASKIRDLLKRAEKATSEGELEPAETKLDRADELTGELEDDFERLGRHSNRAEHALEAVDNLRNSYGLRTSSLMPGGAALDDQFETCTASARSYRRALTEGKSLATLDEREEAFDTCLDRVREVARESSGQFALVVYGVPGVLVFGLLGLLVWKWNNRGLDVETTDLDSSSVERPTASADPGASSGSDDDLRQLADPSTSDDSTTSPLLEEWRDGLPPLSERLDELERAHPDVLSPSSPGELPAALSDEDIERIDLAYALRDRAEQVFEEAQSPSDGIGGVSPERQLQGREIRLGPSNTRQSTRLRRGLDREYRYDADDVLGELETLVSEAEERLDKTDLPDGHW